MPLENDIPSPADKLGGKPWIAWVFSAVAFINVVIGAYLAATVFWDSKLGQSRLPIEALISAGAFITVGTAVYGYSASKVKMKEIESETELQLSEDA